MTRPHSIPRTRAWGLGFAAMTAVISGFAVFTNGYGVRAWSEAGVSSSAYTTLKNLVAAIFLAGLLGYVGRSRRITTSTARVPSTPAGWAGLVTVAVVGGSVPFLLFFEGLARASSTQAALIHKTLVVWVAVLAVPLLKERLGALHFVAIGLLVAGQVALSGGISGFAFGTGEVMVLAATLLWSVEVVVAKRLLHDVSSVTVGAVRMGLGVVILTGYGLATGAFAGLAGITASQWLWVLATGAVLSTYVATWYAGLARAQAVDVTAVLVFGAVVTAVLRTVADGAPLPSLLGVGLVTAGTAVVMAMGLSWGVTRSDTTSAPLRT